MKRLHVHVSVDDLARSIGFYSTLFAAEPSVVKPDYAKAGLDHLGIQVETRAELQDVYRRLRQADRPMLEEGATTCCYAKSEKAWIADPQGVSWETFLTSGESTVYGDSADLGPIQVSRDGQASAGACCGS